MEIRIPDGAAPFVITYRKILKKPKIRLLNKRLPIKQIAINIKNKVLDFCKSVAYETIAEVEEPGRSTAVHWAFNVEDPWDLELGREANLVGMRIEEVPSYGAHFEVVSPCDQSNNIVSDDDDDVVVDHNYGLHESGIF